MSEEKKIYSAVEKKLALQSAIFNLTAQQAFYGSLLQEITLKYTERLPTAAMAFNDKTGHYEMYINPNFFCSLTNEQRVAVFHHEILHFTNKHLFRLPFIGAKEQDRKLYNIAADMAINQFIKGLPEGCVDVKQWKMDDGSLFPVHRAMEEYYELIKKELKKQKKSKKDGKETKGNVEEMLGNYKEFDQHAWESLDEETKKKMLDEAKKVLKRTIEKSVYSHSSTPGEVKDLLQEIDTLSNKMNYKQILKNAIKKTVSFSDRENTWKRPNKRYGVYSPGKKMGELPQLNFYVDTSGSISHTELNEFLSVMDNFLQAGTRTCSLGMWHTALYEKKKYKLKNRIRQEEIQSGGTDVTCVMKDIKDSKPDLSIILTDLFFDLPQIEAKSEVIFIVSKGGNRRTDFPKNYKIIYLEDLK